MSACRREWRWPPLPAACRCRFLQHRNPPFLRRCFSGSTSGCSRDGREGVVLQKLEVQILHLVIGAQVRLAGGDFQNEGREIGCEQYSHEQRADGDQPGSGLSRVVGGQQQGFLKDEDQIVKMSPFRLL